MMLLLPLHVFFGLTLLFACGGDPWSVSGNPESHLTIESTVEALFATGFSRKPSKTAWATPSRRFQQEPLRNAAL